MSETPAVSDADYEHRRRTYHLLLDLIGDYALAYADYSQRDASPLDIDDAEREVQRLRAILADRLRMALRLDDEDMHAW